ncbi:reverse transcriptase domain-containing protein [Tanacetum coccineum]
MSSNTPDYIHPIIVPSDSNVEDAFSSTNTLDYIPASLDYSPASPGNTPFDSLDDLTKNLLASLAISPFHDDPYMKVMQAYIATSNESHILPQALIAPPTVLPPSPVLPLSSMFDPPDFFLPEEILPPHKRARFLSSSSTDLSAPPQVFDIGESSHKTSLERHEEQIETILNHLDELPLERIEHMEDKIKGLDFREQIRHDDEIVLARVMVSTLEMIIGDIQAAIRKQVADCVATALEAQAATMENTDNTNRNTEQGEALVARKCSYKEFMSCQPFNFKGTKGAVSLIRWFERTELVFLHSNCTEDCKVILVKKMEDEFYNLTIKGNDLKTYVRRFQELAVLCPTMVPNFEKLMEVFIGGLPRSIEGNVTASKPKTLEESITITQKLMDQVTKHNSVQGTNDHKQKFDDRRTFNNNNYQNNRNNNNNNRNNDNQQQQNRRQETVKVYAAALTENSRYTGSLPLCKKCTLHYTGPCTVKFRTCNKVGHLTRNYKNKGPATGSNLQPVLITCHACREKGHYSNQFPKANNIAYRRAYLLRDRNAHQDPNVVTDTTYDIENADGNLVGTNTVIQGCTLILINQPFKIDLMPVKLSSFNVAIGMDWLSKYQARIICDEKVIHIPIDGETLIIRGDRIMEKKSDEKRLEDIPVVREFPEVFPEDVPGLPPVRQVEI